MSKHTPGPWFASALRTHSAQGSRDGCDIGADDGTSVGIVYALDLWLPTEACRDGETEANAALVAAAPDLLAALEAMLLGNKHLAPELARAAIAKATGAKP